ncbi:MAG: shikimate kinase [Acidimicrobiia bacterium]|nr:shikimate kinase [Acidimicrobiia bacterium]MXZ84104.1 shikimate kinase [Acidimicrobiia bacterium]MYE72604.1 shikimate kinase [Acidimicrobiia bacterium]MYG72238.1 shikimate kinase [Acidimicrobiia bacterium]MYJ62890.1 shikimate kinase [Acidimicrobiia bacterium]
MESRPHVALIGMMGSGKSTVGFWLAQSEGLRFVDLDAAIEERQGRSVPEIFEADGEDGFREMEQSELAACLAAPQPMVVACGGGAVLRAENRELLRHRAWVCWLRATIDTLGQRVRAGENRPLLGDDPMADLAAIGAARAGLYTETAHEIIDVDGMEAQHVADQIRRVWPRTVSAR